MRYIKMLRTLALALTIALLAMALPATPALAAIADLYPDDGEIGDYIDIYGSGFYTERTVYIYFSSDTAEVNDRIDNEVTAYERVKTASTDNVGDFDTSFEVPDKLNDGDTVESVHAGTYYIYVTHSTSKTIKAVDTFTVETVGAITLNPIEGTVGSEASVSGTGFAVSGTVTISFDGVSVKNTTTDSIGSFTNATFAVPESSQGNHTIEVKDASNNADTATFTTKHLMAITPTSGAAGDTITLSGNGFAASESVTINFDGVPVIGDTTSSTGSFTTSIEALPRAAGSYEVEAIDGDSNSYKALFTIAAFALNVSPLTGHVGTQVTVSGNGFQSSQPITITFDNENVTTTPPNPTTDELGKFTTSFKVPVRTTGTYKVKVSDGTNKAEADFSTSTSASISPVTGNVGTEVTVSGLGFIAGRKTTITYDDTQVATLTVNTDGSFSATFEAPVSKGGAHTIIVTDGTNTKQFTFTMESTPPAIPVLLKPEMDIKAEQPVYFDWEEVTDPSGVIYTLQIATDEEFSEDSIVLEKTELTESEYTIAEEEKLKSVSEDTPYYWHVKAIDDASNVSEWSDAGSFHVGGFSWEISQGLIYTLIGIGAFLLIILSFWLGRKTAYY
ncbi:hypothetical protein ACFLWC_01805 [Chloroflexota bacterium]